MGDWLKFDGVKRWLEKNGAEVSLRFRQRGTGADAGTYQATRTVNGRETSHPFAVFETDVTDGKAFPKGTGDLPRHTEIVTRDAVADLAVALEVDPRDVLGEDFRSRFPEQAHRLDEEEAEEEAEPDRRGGRRRSISGLPEGDWPDPSGDEGSSDAEESAEEGAVR